MSNSEGKDVICKSEQVRTLTLKDPENGEDVDMTGDSKIENMVFTTESFEVCSVVPDQPLCTHTQNKSNYGSPTHASAKPIDFLSTQLSPPARI